MPKKETKQTPEIKFSFDDLSSVHDDIQDESSEPNSAAIEAEREKNAVPVDINVSTSGEVDSEGTVFNPDLHATNAEGEPSKTPKGKWRKKRGASKVATKAEQTEAQKIIESKQKARAAGMVAGNMMINSSIMLLGNEWEPKKEQGMDERAMVCNSFADYFEAKDINDFPPGVALTVCIMAYAMPRMIAGPETKTKLAKAKIWLSGKVNDIKRKRKNAAQSNSRDDGKRKDDDSEKAMQSEQVKGTRHPRT